MDKITVLPDVVPNYVLNVLPNYKSNVAHNVRYHKTICKYHFHKTNTHFRLSHFHSVGNLINSLRYLNIDYYNIFILSIHYFVINHVVDFNDS